MTTSPKKNFQRVFESMQHGHNKELHSDLNEERTKMGTNLKEMGKMSVRTGDIRKEKIKMGDRQSVQVEEELNVEENTDDKLKKENEELINQLDLDSIFQQAQAEKKDETPVEAAKPAPKKAAVKKALKVQTEVDEEPAEAPKQKPVAKKATVKKEAANVLTEAIEEPVEAPKPAAKKIAKVQTDVSEEPVEKKKPLAKKISLKKVAPAPKKAEEPKEEVALEKADELIQTATKHTATPKKLAAPATPAQPAACPKADNSLAELKANAGDFQFVTSDENGNNQDILGFTILPQSARDHIGKEVQVLTSDRILGYNTYAKILDKDAQVQASIENPDFYNVTVNFIVQRNSEFSTGKKTTPVAAPTAALHQSVETEAIQESEEQTPYPKQMV